MCGIVGVIGKSEAASRVLDGLKRLEYRGYDSAGIAVIEQGQITCRRAVGKLAALNSVVKDNPVQGHTAIGHTRWATHGAPNEANTHPHQAGKVVAVHNGIIENFRELREELVAQGGVFVSDTDTEVIVQLCNQYLSQGLSPVEATEKTLARLRGAFALCLIFEGADSYMICARSGAPLAIGYGDGEMFVGSDALALVAMTDRICYLAEGDYAVLTQNDAQIFDKHNQPAARRIQTVSLSAAMVDKGGYRHFMAKEIHEQASVISDTLGRQMRGEGSPIAQLAHEKIDRLTIIACGTAAYAGHIAKYWIESVARIPVEIDIASEFRYRNPPLPKNGVAVFVSQSGETADTVAALRYCKEAGQRIISIVNVPESTIARESDVVLRTYAGPEIGVASTKAFTCQLTVLAILAAELAKAQGRGQAAEAVLAQLTEVPRLVTASLQSESLFPPLASDLSHARDVLYLGRGAMYPLALEGALKLKEISYIHAEGYASGELKHGPIALIDEHVPIVVLAPKDAMYEKTISNMQEVMARGGKVLLISDADGLAEAGEGVWHKIEMPECGEITAPIVYAVAIQLLAYYTAVAKGTDVDQPRNLAKSVTVE